MVRLSMLAHEALAAIAAISLATPGWAAVPKQAPAGGALEIKPIVDARLRYEFVEQGELDANAPARMARVRAHRSSYRSGPHVLGHGLQPMLVSLP